LKVPLAEPDLTGREIEYVLECLRSGWISGKGGFVSEFEGEFASYLGIDNAIAVSSGTAALHLAVKALKIGPGDEVILPTFAMIACANAIRYVGAKPVFVDSEASTWNIDPMKIEEKITSRTKAIMVTHTYGHPADMDPIMEIAEDYNLYVIEDASEALGAKYKGRNVGTIGHIACFSLYANKIITTGEGGMVVTENSKLARVIRSLRDQCYDLERRKWLIHNDIGYSYRMTNIQAAIGLAQLERIDDFIKRHRRNARLYNTLLRSLPGITLPNEERGAAHVYWMYTILVDESEFGIDRDTLMLKLEEKDIETRAVFWPIHLQPPYKAEYGHENYPIAENLSRRGINLPSGNTLSERQIYYVVACIKQIYMGDV